MKEKLINLFHEVIDDSGNMKACGRYKCMELIKLCDEIVPQPSGYYGNLKTGCVDKEHIIALFKSITDG